MISACRRVLSRACILRPMAIWQFDVCILPSTAPHPTRGSDGYDRAPVNSLAAAQAMAWCGERWQRHEWMDDFFVFGDDQGCRIDVFIDEDGSAELSARIDLRRAHDNFCLSICQLASELECVLFSPEFWCPIPTDASSLLEAARRSRAARFVMDPRSFLRDSSPN